ncbi:hypothetical protein, partial [Sphingobium xanthum]
IVIASAAPVRIRGRKLDADQRPRKVPAGHRLHNRRAIARALCQILLHERSISVSEIDFADSNIAW